MCVGHGHRVDVGHGLLEPGPIHQCGSVAQIGKRRHSAARAAQNLCFGGHQGLTQLRQRHAAEKSPQKQASRLQGAPDLDQRADDIVSPVQTQGRDDQVNAAVREGQPLFVSHQSQAWASLEHRRRQVYFDQGVDLTRRF